MGGRALVVGASRGLGLALTAEYLARGWAVVATERSRGDGALQALADGAAGRLRIVAADVDASQAPLILAAALDEAFAEVPLDLLFHSAGVLGDAEAPAGRLAPADFAAVMGTNALAPLRVIEALGGRVAPGGAIVAMSSILGSVGGNAIGGYDAYRASKAALNTLLRCHAARHPDRCVIAMHPGWVRTAMGGSNAALAPADSARGMADAVAARAGRAGCAFIDWRGHAIEW